MQLKLVMFDIGGVVVDVANTVYFNYLSEVSGVPPAEVERRLIIDAAPFEKGYISPKRFTEEFAEDLGISEGKVLWAEYFRRIATLNSGTVSIIKRLKRNYRIAYLSNVDVVRYGYVRKHVMNGVLRLFNYEFASFKLKCTKPSPVIYKKVLGIMGLEPENVIFIDNDYHNVESARKLGIESVLFTHPQFLSKELKQLGVRI